MKFWALIGVLVIAGCASSVPTHQWHGSDAAVATLAARARSIHSVRATATLILTSADNQRVTLDAAIVARSDQDGPRLRIRTWKFGQAVLDLTARPEGVWIASDANSADAQPAANQRLQALRPEQIAQAWNLFFGDFFAKPGLTINEQSGPAFTVTRREEDATIACDIDRATLTAREYRITDDRGQLHQTLTLARYQVVDNATWPMMLTAQGDQGRVEVRFDEVEINPELEDNVFVPPQRAVKQQ
jgi:hypothetical protein